LKLFVQSFHIPHWNCKIKIHFMNLSKVVLLTNHDIHAFSNMFDLNMVRVSRCVHSSKWFGNHLNFLHCRSGMHFVIDFLCLFDQRHGMMDALSYSIRLFVHIEKVLISMVSFHILRRNLVIMLEIVELFQSAWAVFTIHNLIRWEMLLILRIGPGVIQTVHQIHGFVMISRTWTSNQLITRFVHVVTPITIICDFGHWRVRSMEASESNWIVERTTQNWITKERSQHFQFLVQTQCIRFAFANSGRAAAMIISLSVQLRSSESSWNQNNKLSDRSVWHQVLFNHWLSHRAWSAAGQQTIARFGNKIMFIDSRSSRIVITGWRFASFGDCVEMKSQFKLLRLARATLFRAALALPLLPPLDPSLSSPIAWSLANWNDSHSVASGLPPKFAAKTASAETRQIWHRAWNIFNATNQREDGEKTNSFRQG
jgi:hypothetical protein